MGIRFLGLCVAVTATLVACGPIGYVSNVRSASTAVEEARAVNAAKYAPYEWTRAVEYLHAARAEAAMADFEAANRFGRLASEAATKAKADAIRRAGDPRAMDEITAPPGAGRRSGTGGGDGGGGGGGGLAPVKDEGDDPDDETPAELDAP
ncbi:MAG TPA: DUF4398 domain-containing protein [Kofleriaceae bacterium]|nr:DUF4398 domain-containing protein [Kofleriaceae bacterium]